MEWGQSRNSSDPLSSHEVRDSGLRVERAVQRGRRGRRGVGLPARAAGCGTTAALFLDERPAVVFAGLATLVQGPAQRLGDFSSDFRQGTAAARIAL